ncbi:MULTISPECIES: NAD(P)/FAD-dependent oxidoreductase [Burkholderia]|uniref:FAD-dependent oxidoreductase n=1 Tax=Burkholderia savannae TaxID=1637837 RepID=A0ABR5T776_9BURK|nr:MULTISPECIES: FAD-binding oxidoreductase [Burkholderia]AOJ72462.1 FAD-dependent oxidoreductase [Burkholderia savannae]AOJ82898.1 FAD-dependent oxidoreductase [Burkholderia savannae]AOK50856.1 FAD-dependent oxidoreductase [Burkholderia sp. MSMB617WGS]KGR92977.1 pyridine nucleotide-disulfide oxidoreductase family protein [Burkholderia sp. ABCPW 111]KVG46210.1 FAD-dependent oxidoreductase [Burkholderia sp. MSMB0265]
MKFESYWLDTRPEFCEGCEAPVEGRADVVVIGGGFTGLSAALELAKRGVQAVVLEAGQIAAEASGRNGGQCNTGLAQDYAALAARVGAPRAQAFYRAYASAVATVDSIVAEHAIDCDFLRTGKLKLAAKPQHFAGLAKTFELLRRDVDPDVELIEPAHMRDEVGSDRFYGGLLQRTGAQMHMGKFGVGLARAAVARGARVYEHAAVTQLKRLDGERHEITSTRGTIRADRVLVATGASQLGPFQWFRRRIAPVGSFIVVTEPLPKAQLDRLFPNRRAYVTTRHIGNYFRVTPDDRLLFGGRARFALSNPHSDAKSGDILRAGMAAYFPELANVRLDYCWGGLVDITADRLPRAGQHEGLYYSMGYSGHGVQMSVHMGRVMADVLYGAAASNPWRELDWPAMPGHFGHAWFLPFVGAYYRLQDILH